MRKAWFFAAIAMAMVSTAAFADELDAVKPRDVGEGYQIYWAGSGAKAGAAKELRVKKGKRSAPLVVGDKVPTSDDGAVEVSGHVKVDAASGGKLSLSYAGIGCEQASTYTEAQLAARLDTAEADALRKRGKKAEAAALYLRAWQADDQFFAAARGWALVQLQLGKPDDGSALLASSVNPLQEYLRAASDPKLEALIKNGAPGLLGGQRDSKPGTAQLDGKALTLSAPGIARNRFGELVSVETSGGHGMCAYTTRLVFRSGSDLVAQASLPLVESDDYPAVPRQGSDEQCDEGKPPPRWAPGAAVVAKRVALANRLLAELGFSPIQGDVSSPPTRAASGAQTTRFGDIGLVIGDDGSARYFLKQRMLAEYGAGSTVPGQLATAILSVEQNRVFVVTKQIGCHREEQVWMGALPIPERPASSPATSPAVPAVPAVPAAKPPAK